MILRIGGDKLVIQELKYQHDKNEKLKYNIRIISRSFVIAVVVLVLLLFTYLIIYFGDQFLGVKTGKNKKPMLGAYVIVSPSMIPSINVNDGIVVQRVERENNLQVGDVITFESNNIEYNGLTVTHRIVGKQMVQTGEYVYRTKGDNNVVEDSSLVKFGDIYGKVIMKIPMIGYVYKFLTKPLGFIISFIVPVAILIFGSVYRSINDIKGKKAEII